MSDMKQQLVDIDNARVPEQLAEMQQILREGHCPFCPEHLAKHHKDPIVRETKYWLLTPNQWPYKHTKVHLLAIYKQHAVDLVEIDPEAGQDLLELMQWASREYQVLGGAFAMRFGDTNYSAGSVNHIHAQFIQPDLDDPEYQPVRIKVGKSRE